MGFKEIWWEGVDWIQLHQDWVVRSCDHIIEPYGRIILKWVLKEYSRRVWTGFNCIRIGQD
jgi:hypothetical protein